MPANIPETSRLQPKPDRFLAILQAPLQFLLLIILLRFGVWRFVRLQRLAALCQGEEFCEIAGPCFRPFLPKTVAQVRDWAGEAGNDFQVHRSIRTKLGELLEINF